MAKKVVAKSRSKDAKALVKLIRCARSPKTGAYAFKSDIVSAEEAQRLLNNKKS